MKVSTTYFADTQPSRQGLPLDVKSIVSESEGVRVWRLHILKVEAVNCHEIKSKGTGGRALGADYQTTHRPYNKETGGG